MANKEFSKIIRNNSGLVSADFIFSLVIAAGVCVVLFVVTFTLSMTEVAQYFAFSAARSMAGADVDVDAQKEAARNKYKTLLANPVFSSIFGGDGSWFVLSKDIEVRTGEEGGESFLSEYGQGDLSYQEQRSIYTGVRFSLLPKLMALRVAFLGSTSLEGDGSDFGSNVNAIILREPTFRECMDLQVKKRYEMLGKVEANGEGNRYQEYVGRGLTDYQPMEDNGC